MYRNFSNVVNCIYIYERVTVELVFLEFFLEFWNKARNWTIKRIKPTLLDLEITVTLLKRINC
jgi:hypothetical protein